MDRKDGPLAETPPMTSDTAVNAEEREIARTMDDEKQREDLAMERPQERRIEQMIENAEQKQGRQKPPNARDVPLP